MKTETKTLPIKLIVLMLGILLTATACTTSLETIKTKPQRYAGERVYIQGTLDHKLPIPFTSVGVYILNDSTASMVLIGPTEYETGQKIKTRAQVIGISEDDAVQTAQNTVKQIADTLVSQQIVTPAGARKVASAVVTVVSKISGPISGSYLLIDARAAK